MITPSSHAKHTFRQYTGCRAGQHLQGVKGKLKPCAQFWDPEVAGADPCQSVRVGMCTLTAPPCRTSPWCSPSNLISALTTFDVLLCAYHGDHGWRGIRVPHRRGSVRKRDHIQGRIHFFKFKIRVEIWEKLLKHKSVTTSQSLSIEWKDVVRINYWIIYKNVFPVTYA